MGFQTKMVTEEGPEPTSSRDTAILQLFIEKFSLKKRLNSFYMTKDHWERQGEQNRVRKGNPTFHMANYCG